MLRTKEINYCHDHYHHHQRRGDSCRSKREGEFQSHSMIKQRHSKQKKSWLKDSSSAVFFFFLVYKVLSFLICETISRSLSSPKFQLQTHVCLGTECEGNDWHVWDQGEKQMREKEQENQAWIPRCDSSVRSSR